MRLGLLSDIHEDVERLRAALDVLAGQRLDRLVLLGDVCDCGERLDETAALLRDAGAEGVWGNHDLALCLDPPERLRRRHRADTLDFMARLRPQRVLDGCLFSHVEPWLDPCRPEEIWYFDGPPDTPQKLQRCFAAVPEWVIFLGHLHRWLHGTPAGLSSWSGDDPLFLPPDVPHLVVIHTLTEGCFATYDTAARLLTPFDSPLPAD